MVDVLDDMSTAPKASLTKQETMKEGASITTTSTNTTINTTTTTCVDEEDPAEQDLDDLLGNDEFAKQLAAGMEQLMGQMGTENNDEMKDAFEKVWASLGDEKIDQAPPTQPSPAAPSRQVPQSFQETIGKTMNKLKDSSKEIDVSPF